MTRRSIVFVLACLAVVSGAVLAAPALSAQVHFIGIHPIPKSEGGGICYIEGPHVHVYAANKIEFRDHGRDHYFVGDPVAYGYDGPRFAYKGPHPIHVEAVVGGDPDVEYCYLTGPHFHSYAPPDGPDFKLQGDAYFYVGEPPRAFVDARPMYFGINDVYRPMVYERPVVTIDAPVGWIGARAELVGPGVVVGALGAVVVDPRGVAVGIDAAIHVPVPSIHIGVGLGVGVGGPVLIEQRGKHDNGRHGHKGR